MAEIVFTDPALAELDAIADYIGLDNPLAAKKLVTRVFDHVAQLELHPNSGSRPRELPGQRYRQIVEPPCRIIYRATDAIVYVVHVARCEQRLSAKQFAPRSKQTTKR